MNPYMTIEDVAKIYNIKIVTARAWLKRGRIKGKKIGRRWLFTEKDIKI